MAPRMTLAEARAVLNGDKPATPAETGYATGIVLARLDEIERRCVQVEGGHYLKFARADEVARWISTGNRTEEQ